MMAPIYFVFCLILASAYGTSCPSPTVNVIKSFTTTDASILTAIAYLSQFELKCNGKAPEPSLNFYAEVNGKHLNVARTPKGTFQVSWTEEVLKASSGTTYINIYDQDTFPQVKKAKGELPPPLVTVSLHHPGAYSGPILSSEHIAAILGIFVVYIAITCRSKLLS